MNLSKGNVVICKDTGFTGFVVGKEKDVKSSYRVRGLHGSSFIFTEDKLLLLHEDILKKAFIKKSIKEMEDRYKSCGEEVSWN